MAANGNGKPVVIVDDREPSSAVPRLAEYGLQPVVGRMDAGDYAIFPHGLRGGFEVKTISDILNGISTKRLVDQLHRMIEAYDFSILLRRGEFRRDESDMLAYRSPGDPRANEDGWVVSGWGWRSWQGFMRDITFMGVMLWDCPVPSDYPYEIAQITLSLCADKHHWIQERQRPVIMTVDKQYRAACWSLCAFEHVGPEWGDALLRDLGSFDRVVNASVDELANVKIVSGSRSMSFGKKRAARLREEFEREWTS